MYYNFPTIIHVKDRHYYDEKKAIYTEDEHGASNLNVDGLDAEGYEMDKQRYKCMLVDILQMLKGIWKMFVLVYFLRVIENKSVINVRKS